MVSGVGLGMNGTLGNTLSGCVTKDPKVGPAEACAIHSTHPIHLVASTSEVCYCACRLIHKWINEGLRSILHNMLKMCP